MGFFSQLKDKITNQNNKDEYLKGFKKTNESLGSKLFNLKRLFKTIDDEFLEELMIVLLESDVGIHTAKKICDRLNDKANEYINLSFDQVMELLIETMHELYTKDGFDQEIHMNPEGPTVILMVGVNGAGKTTSIAKLAHQFKTEGKKVAVVAADTFRAGAVDQLANWAEKIGVESVLGNPQEDPSSVLVKGCRYANEQQVDILLCDTAGRLQNKVNLMNELSKMHRVLDKEIKGAPHNVWLVIDASTGQNGLSQASLFNEITKLTGIILSKMDGTSKGGIVLAIKDTIRVGVNYIGLGEKMEDLKPFDLDLYLYSITQGMNKDA